MKSKVELKLQSDYKPIQRDMNTILNEDKWLALYDILLNLSISSNTARMGNHISCLKSLLDMSDSKRCNNLKIPHKILDVIVIIW